MKIINQINLKKDCREMRLVKIVTRNLFFNNQTRKLGKSYFQISLVTMSKSIMLSTPKSGQNLGQQEIPKEYFSRAIKKKKNKRKRLK